MFIAFEVKLLTNPGKLSLAKEIPMFVNAFFPKFPNQESKDPRDGIIFRYLTVTKFYICLHIVSSGNSAAVYLVCHKKLKLPQTKITES